MINFKRGVVSYIDSPDCIVKNTVDKCFQYAVTVSLTYGEIKWNPERVSNIKLFINTYNWK